MKLDLAKHILQIKGIAVGALIGALHDTTASGTQARRTIRGTNRRRQSGKERAAEPWVDGKHMKDNTLPLWRRRHVE